MPANGLSGGMPASSGFSVTATAAQLQARGPSGGGAPAGAGSGSHAKPHVPTAPLVLSDYSPLRIAFHDRDTRFMSSQVCRRLCTWGPDGMRAVGAH